MINMFQLMQIYQQLRSNPSQILAQRFNLPNIVNTNNPNDIIQYLLNTGQVQQNQVNQVMGMQKNPVIQQLLQMRF